MRKLMFKFLKLVILKRLPRFPEEVNGMLKLQYQLKICHSPKSFWTTI